MPNRFTPKVGLKLGGLPVVMFILIDFRDPGVLGSLAVTYALIGWLMTRQWDIWRGRGGSIVTTWAALLVVPVLGSGLFGVHDELYLTNDQAFALRRLVLGVGYAAAGIGVKMGRSVQK
ncbi:hypothetical protein [Haloquadratum walsbyi]|nr:hypothetical protein [Haloquadratum walsbyi]